MMPQKPFIFLPREAAGFMSSRIHLQVMHVWLNHSISDQSASSEEVLAAKAISVMIVKTWRHQKRLD